ncbi:MAG: 50S ribosomal protein L30e [Acidilobaceae archaeon]|nr:50S ribosomal protein L30e [Acidilobaceae archaeon]MCX8165635.1 50S ribosomal protein L30e [Acidilobaceae archaeon]MDW7974061.1 50S ribosomal protein L30e [Sulfolobales archaeon]
MAQVPLDREIKNLVKTGKYYLGARRTLKALMKGEAKMIIVASNAPREVREAIERRASIAGIPVVVFQGRSVDLGLAAGKPFSISAIAVVEQGTSRLLDMIR